MPELIAYLGPTGTYTESAAIACAQWLSQTKGITLPLMPYPSIAQAIRAVAQQEVPVAVVPVENSTEGSVRMTLDTVWQFDALQIQQALVLPISHALLSRASGLEAIEIVYSHPQAISQCQGWLEKFLPTAQLIPTNSTTEALQHLDNPHIGAISSERAAHLYNLPILAHPINDLPDNCTRFWIISLEPASTGKHTSLAFNLPANVPGSLVKTLDVLARRNINLSRIESRPTKRAIGDYLFFVDLEADLQSEAVQSALAELRSCTETLKIFGSYNIQTVVNGQLKPE
ncbi:prephenate dehydratase [Leptolyngbya sp. FACHB-711]|jgi:prephenate dehydratase|uniref:prephenate dehydratase n=1 Tax=unclassified Leptolyngbya TaxID=2650499 RepID=UPI00168A0837|nr:prephenate dehydratase [Leptolyngbya sp. FACHB-711]MBD1850382.1 prephenate dehydratase [Cyanobacteria bacterium FACHB-502]MBD2024639.1 prephenate dehydratase [Leptolyngbya sp. FACHB-711]